MSENAESVNIPEWLESQVKRDNTEFVLDSAIYQQQFFNFVKLAMQISADLYLTQHQYPIDYHPNFWNLKWLNLEVGWRVMTSFLARYSDNSALSPICDAMSATLVNTGSHISFTSSPSESLLV